MAHPPPPPLRRARRVARAQLAEAELLELDLAGMMSFLQRYPKPDALRADVLIRAALELKVTNRMLGELEREWNQRMADGLEDE